MNPMRGRPLVRRGIQIVIIEAHTSLPLSPLPSLSLPPFPSPPSALPPADTWPEVLDDTNARQDWGWRHEYDLQKIVEDMVMKLRQASNRT